VPASVAKGRLFAGLAIYRISCLLGGPGGAWVKAEVQEGKVERLKRISPDIPWVTQVYSITWVTQGNPGTTRISILS
jgi:hypothetical protein